MSGHRPGEPFTPEDYVKSAHWIPQDAFVWEHFSASSLSELEAKRDEFKAKNAGKLQIIKATYWEMSLRSLFPDRWGLAYESDSAWIIVDDKKVPCYSQRKFTLYFKSIIFGYGDGPIQRVAPSREIAKYIKEHCASSARLKAISLRAYESTANCKGYHTWTSAGQSVFLCLAAAHSSLDSIAAVLWALLFKETPQGRDVPSMSLLFRKLCPNGWAKNTNRLPFGDEFVKLYESRWFKNLKDARDKVVHRSAAPFVQDKLGIAFDFDLGMFKDIQPGFHSTPCKSKLGANMKCIHLDKIMKGFVIGLEKWEKKIASKLATLACFQSYNTDGILLGIDFVDQNLRWDSSGPSHSIRSSSPELLKLQIKRARRAQNKTRARSLGDTHKP